MSSTKGQKRKKSSNPPQNITAGGRHNNLPKWLLVGAIIALLGGIVYYMSSTTDYSGPRFADSERGVEKQREKMMKESQTSTDEEDDTSTCEELTREAQKLLKTNKQSNIQLALDMLATCILKDESNPVSKWNIAMALVQVNRSLEALPFIDETLTLAPNNTNYLLTGGRILAKQNFHKEAVKCFEMYLELKLGLTSWKHTLEIIGRQREDELLFLHEAGDDMTSILEDLLSSYLHLPSFIKASYLYRVVIGLRGMENSHNLIGQYAFYSFSIGDIANGIGYLQYHTEMNYVKVGYGSIEQARQVIKAHSLRLLTSGIDATIVSIVRNLLMVGSLVWDELVYHCDISNNTLVEYNEIIKLTDIKQIYTKCLISQNLVKELIDRGASVHAENIFGWTPLLQIISLDDPTVLHQILKANADVQARTAMGHTSLHVAAMKGSTHVVLPLLQAGLKASTSDALNRTAVDVACDNRWFADEFSKAIQVQMPFGCGGPPTHYMPRLKEGFSTGGWLPSGVQLPGKLTSEKCDIDVIGYEATAEQLVLHYLSLQKPVLIRNAANSKSMKKLFTAWQRDKLEKQYGKLKFKEVLVPYAESFGYDHTHITLKEFLQKMADLNEEQQQAKNVLDLPPPTYIFQTVPAANSRLMEHFVLPNVLNVSVTEIALDKIQFYVGGALSGAPPHFHRSAWNLLVYGRKRWFIFPPKYAFYTKKHVWDWWKSRYSSGRGKDNESGKEWAWECVQYPGDMIVLPDMWGHAVINLQESVGVASEFVYGPSEFSL